MTTDADRAARDELFAQIDDGMSNVLSPWEGLRLLRRLLEAAEAERNHYADLVHKLDISMADVTAERDAAIAERDALRSDCTEACDLAAKCAEELGDMRAARDRALRVVEAAISAMQGALDPDDMPNATVVSRPKANNLRREIAAFQKEELKC